MKGRYHLNKGSVGDGKSAIGYFEEAIRQDPSYALAYAGLAEAAVVLPQFENVFSHEMYPKARSAAQRALELDPSLAEAHAALATLKTFHDWDWSAPRKNSGWRSRSILTRPPPIVGTAGISCTSGGGTRAFQK